MTYTPKLRFQSARTKEELSELAQRLVLPELRDCITAVLAQMAWKGASQDQLQGAKMFSMELLSIADPPELAEKYTPTTIKMPA